MPQISKSTSQTTTSKTSSTTTKTMNKSSKDEEAWPEDNNSSKQKLDEFQRMEMEIKREVSVKEKKDSKKKKRPKNTEQKNGNKRENYQNKDSTTEGKHVGPRIRSFDANKMKNKFNKTKESSAVSSECKVCGKQVYQMEKIVAEKSAWHKNCFRCKQCEKFLTLENYQSHEGSVYCQPHFKELFRPKVVMQSEEDQHLERLSRKPKMIVLESNPVSLPDNVVRATVKPDYGLEELQETLNVKERFELFENYTKEELPAKEPVPIKRADSLMAKVARFMEGNESNSFGEEGEENDLENESDQEEQTDEDGTRIVRNTKKKERPMSFSGMGDLKAAWEQKQRREEMSQARKEEVAKFRQLLCAGKNLSLKEKFEAGLEGEETPNNTSLREEIRIEGKRAASNLRKRFEEGAPFIIDEEENGEEETESETVNGTNGRKMRSKTSTEVNEIFKHADTAKEARNVFKKIDSKVAGDSIIRSPSGLIQNKRLSVEIPNRNDANLPSPEVVKSSDKNDDFQINTADLANKFKFFSNYENELEKERSAKKSTFRITPPREGIDNVVDNKQPNHLLMPKPCMAVNCEACKIRRSDDPEALELLGRDPNLIKCTDNYQDEIDCRNTKNILQMFRNMEMSNEDENVRGGPRPLKCFTPPLDSGECGESSEGEYSDDYTDEEDDSDGMLQPEIRDEILQMLSAKKAAELRAKFEKWEANGEPEKEAGLDEEGEKHVPSLDKARNLRAMFESKANESATGVVSSNKPTVNKIKRFV